jgi:hypothetical protein
MSVELDLAPRFVTGCIRPRVFAWLARVGFASVALFFSARWLIQWLPRYLPKDWARAHEADALIDWKGARLFTVGVSPFSPEGLAEIGVANFGHPPTTSFWFLPLATFDKALTAELIGLSVWFCLVIHVYLCARAVKFPAPVMLTALVWCGFIATQGFFMHFWAVQLSEHIAFAYVLSWWFLRRGQDTSAGILLGIAGTLKLFPGLLILFLLLARKWRAFAAAALTFLLVAGVMTSVYGFDSWLLFFTQQGPIADKWLGHVRNASLQGIVVRLFSPICEGHAVASTATTVVTAVVALALLGGAAYLSWKPLKRARSEDLRAIDLPFALFSMLSVFLNPWVWEHYTVLLIQPAFMIAATLLFAFRHTLRAWLDERTSHWLLARESLCLVVGVAGLVSAIAMIGSNVRASERLLELWRSTGDPWYHSRLHLFEAINYLPWVIVVLACFLCFIPRPIAADPSGRPLPDAP